MTAKDKIAKILKVKALKLKDQNDLAMKSDILPNTLTVALTRGVLSDEIVMKIHDKIGVRREFLEDGIEPIMEENLASVPNERDYPEKPLRVEGDLVIPQEIFHREYMIVPRALYFWLQDQLVGLQQDAAVKKGKKKA